MFRRPKLAIVFASLALLAAFGPSCAAPVLPLPPPTALIEGPPDENGIVVISGEAEPSSFVMCVNETTMSGVIEFSDETGAYTLRIRAASGDVLTIRHLEGGMSRELVVP